jgi:hypothetical protein
MSINRLRKFRTIDEVQTFLNGGVWSGNRVTQVQGPPSNQAPGITGLVGLTLILSAPGPAGTVTFTSSSNANPATLLFKDIKSQIESAIAGVLVSAYDGYLTIIESTPTNGITVSHTGTANALLGFDTSVSAIGHVYPPAAAAATPVAPYWVWAYSGNDNMHNIYTVE